MKEQKDILAVNLISASRNLLKYWYVLAFFAVISLTFAYLYIKYTSKTYNVSGSIVLRHDKNRGLNTGNQDILRSFDFMVQDKTFNNEIFYLQSLPLLREVIAEMDVRTYYFVQDDKIPKRFTFGMENIYKDSPIIVIPEEGSSQPVNVLFHIDILNENRFLISASETNVALVDFRSERTVGYVPEFELSGIYDFGATVSSEHASFRVILNSNYQPGRFAGKDIFFQFNNLNQLVWSFKAGLEIQAQGIESTLAHINLKTVNYKLGVDFMNKLIETYIERNDEEANLMANKTIEHIDNQLEDISGDLSLSERQLQNLRLNRNVMDIDEKSKNIYQQLQNFENRRDEVQRRLNHFRQMNDYFMQFKDSARMLAPSALGLNDQVLNGLINELTTLNSEKSRIIGQDQLRNPRLATLNIRIENLKDVITENINFSLATTRNELEDIESRIASLNREFSSLPGTQRELLDIERRFTLNDAIYTTLLERRIQAQIIKASKLPDAKIIEPPRASGVAGPQGSLIYLLALMAGVGFPSALIMAQSLIVNRLSSKDDVKLITNTPSIGSIPISSTKDKIILNQPQSVIAESFYMLRSNLVYYLHGESSKVILVTSSIPGEGKSFSAFNLATSFAFSNSKTILVEFDLRKPSEVMDGFNTRDIPGVSSYLINRASLEQIIIKTNSPNLDIIQAGQIPPNPIALLSSNRTKDLIRNLREQYDYVIIDTPPYGLLTDSFLLMNHADLNLFVTRLNYTKKSVFASSMEDLESKNIDNLYLLINGEKNEMMSYGYGKYYLKKDSKGKSTKRKKIA